MTSFPLPVTLHCQCREHHEGVPRPDAQVRLNFHGCRQVAYCRACARGLLDLLTEAVAADGVLQCGSCGHASIVVADFVAEGAL
ncbi:hypothetical protein [Nocardia otitidiscaviarum]|uniref:hypothetical protein n=1 Tax=Nocardia otitidiscaviarum TaxID=1823 RepID=UPI0004A7424E|nr:hypothetical protein [Nocardia otitidiscaviarum]